MGQGYAACVTREDTFACLARSKDEGESSRPQAKRGEQQPAGRAAATNVTVAPPALSVPAAADNAYKAPMQEWRPRPAAVPLCVSSDLAPRTIDNNIGITDNSEGVSHARTPPHALKVLSDGLEKASQEQSITPSTSATVPELALVEAVKEAAVSCKCELAKAAADVASRAGISGKCHQESA